MLLISMARNVTNIVLEGAGPFADVAAAAVVVAVVVVVVVVAVVDFAFDGNV
jgi:hypothetical protein